MAMGDNVLYLERAARRTGRSSPQSDLRAAVGAGEGSTGPEPGAAEGAEEILTASELGEAAEIISALTALVDAGLVVVHQDVHGPPRYGLGDGLGDAA